MCFASNYEQIIEVNRGLLLLILKVCNWCNSCWSRARTVEVNDGCTPNNAFLNFQTILPWWSYCK